MGFGDLAYHVAKEKKGAVSRCRSELQTSASASVSHALKSMREAEREVGGWSWGLT
jgi:hypothetical protein